MSLADDWRCTLSIGGCCLTLWASVAAAQQARSLSGGATREARGPHSINFTMALTGGGGAISICPDPAEKLLQVAAESLDCFHGTGGVVGAYG